MALSTLTKLLIVLVATRSSLDLQEKSTAAASLLRSFHPPHDDIRPVNARDFVRRSSHEDIERTSDEAKFRHGRYQRDSDDEIEEIMEPEDEIPNPSFQLRLSEINPDNPGLNTNVFLELEATQLSGTTSSDNDLSGYKLLVIRGNSLELVMAVDLHKIVKQVTNPYIVLGKAGNINVHVDLASSSVESIYSTSTLLPDFDDSLYAILIVNTVFQSELNDLTLNKENDKYVAKSLDPLLRELIREITIDMQVVGRKVKANVCNYFERIRAFKSHDSIRKVLLRDWDSPNEYDRDFSLNNCCSETTVFETSCWYLGIPSPETQNDCTRKQIVLEEFILELTNAKLPESTFEESECSVDYPGVSSTSYDLLNDHQYTKAVGDTLLGRWACGSSSSASVAQVNEVEVVQDSDENLPSIPFFKFQEQTFKHCKKYLPDNIQKIDVPEIREWLHMRVHADKCVFSCHICKTYFKHGFRPDIKHKKEIVSKGYFSELPFRNKHQILHHLNSDLHAAARSYYTALKSASTEDEVRKAVENAESVERGIFRPTMNALTLGYAALRAGVSFRAYPKIVKGVSILDVPLGTHHNNEYSLQRFSDTFSTAFHTKLLLHLVESNVPFSLLTDATTYQNVPYLVCLLQSIEDDHPIIYFWGLIELKNGEASKEMWEDLQERIELDNFLVPGFENYFKQNIVGFISDMASTMIGKKSSLWAHLKTYINREIPNVSCSNHRLERVIHHSLNFITGHDSDKSFMYYSSFREKNNKFYSFYMSYGSKRWAHLTETAKELGLTPYRIKYHFSIRWAASSRRAMDTIFRDYDILANDLKSQSQDDKQLSKETVNKARELYNIIADKTFAITVSEFVDFLTVFEKMSLALQTTSALLIGKVKVLRSGFEELRELKLNIGKKVSEFLGNCSCAGVCEETGCTLTQYDSCSKVLKGGIELSDLDLTAAKLSDNRVTLYNNIEAQMKKYFNSEQLEAFELFNPRYFKWSCSSTASQGACTTLDNCYKDFVTIDPDSSPESAEDKFQTVCTFYLFNTQLCTRIRSSWESLLEQIVVSSEFEKMEYEDPTIFWPIVLANTQMAFSEDIKSFIQRIMVTGLSNSESERAFSITTRYKSGDRSTLSSRNLESLLRISINGPDTLSEKSIYNYAKEFLKKYSRVDDPHGGGRLRKSDKNFFAKSRLF